MNLDKQEVRELVERALVENKRIGTTRLRVPCPVCEMQRAKRDESLAMSVEASTGLFTCWRCHSSGKLREAPNENLLGSRAHMRSVLSTVVETAPKPVEYNGQPPPGFMELGVEPGLTYPLCDDARAYLRTRAITDSMMAELHIGACLFGYYANRVVVPIIVDGVWRGWVGRDYSGTAERKYTYPRGMKRGQFFYNHSAIHEVTDEPLLVVEGVFDALALWPNAVAVLGSPSHAHLDMLSRCDRPVVFVPDGDAWEAGEAHALFLRFNGRIAGCVKLPPKKDPDEVDRMWLDRQVQHSLRW